MLLLMEFCFKYKFDYTRLLILCGNLLAIELAPGLFDENVIFRLVSVSTTLHCDEGSPKRAWPMLPKLQLSAS